MSENLVVGLAVMAACLAIQCVVVGALLEVLLVLRDRVFLRITLVRASLLLVGVMLMMLAGNLVQVTIWAWVFIAYGEFREFSTAFYHSLVNFSTLGYGDIVMSEERRLLGALEGANGVLMFGLTTGVLYMILSDLMSRHWNQASDRGATGQQPGPR